MPINSQVSSYIAERRKAGLRDFQIRQELLSAGWKEDDIAAGLGLLRMPTATGSPPPDHLRWIVLALLAIMVFLILGFVVYQIGIIKKTVTPSYAPAAAETQPEETQKGSPTAVPKPSGEPAAFNGVDAPWCAFVLSSSEAKTIFGRNDMVGGSSLATDRTCDLNYHSIPSSDPKKAITQGFNATAQITQCIDAAFCRQFFDTLAQNSIYSDKDFVSGGQGKFYQAVSEQYAWDKNGAAVLLLKNKYVIFLNMEQKDEPDHIFVDFDPIARRFMQAIAQKLP